MELINLRTQKHSENKAFIMSCIKIIEMNKANYL